MSAGLAEQAVLGVQTPRLCFMPEGDWDYSLGEACAEWARTTLGHYLDPWERFTIRMMGARRPDGRWVCPEFGMCLARRNGKSDVIVIWFLFCLLVLGDRVVEYTAHHGRTVRTTFRLAWRILDAALLPLPKFTPYKSAGRESLMFEGGQEFAFSTRTASAGRGTGADKLAVDEAQEADDDEMDALTPILGDRSISGNPQMILAGSSGNFLSVVFARFRRAALAGLSKRLGWVEWSIDDGKYFAADVIEREVLARSVESIAQANPALGIVRPDGSGGLSLDWLLGQIDNLSPAGFAREHLGVGTWPKDDGHDWVIPRAQWTATARPDGDLPAGALVFAVSASQDDRSFSISAAGAVEDGVYGWLERMDRGSAWVAPELVRLVSENRGCAVIVDSGGPASPLADEIEKALDPSGVPLHRTTSRESAQSQGALSDAVVATPPSFFHRGQPDVNAAVAGMAKKTLGEGLWVADRRHSVSDVAPFESLALARWGFVKFGVQTYDVLASVF